jgi:ribonuclease HI
LTEERWLLLYTDGASRGNPGRSAVGYAIFNPAGDLIEKGAKTIGVRTNNEAEYEALLWGIERVRARSCRYLRVVSDSEVMVRQVNGRYEVRAENLKKYAQQVAVNKRLFERFEATNAPREDPRIVLVDALVNEALDKER